MAELKEMALEKNEGTGPGHKRVRKLNRQKLLGKLKNMQMRLRKSFLNIDEDGNCQLDKGELRKMLKSCDPDLNSVGFVFACPSACRP